MRKLLIRCFIQLAFQMIYEDYFSLIRPLDMTALKFCPFLADCSY
uniref:Uncharacterized protein n=1 Tax=Rhizophora mucronata TaxID=61149 RepID=A0A2P2PXH8_RHIMU